MKVNINRLFCIHFGLRNCNYSYSLYGSELTSNFERCELRSLGLIRDNKLSFNSLIYNICLTTRRIINLAFKIFTVRRANVYLSIYKLYVIQQLDYLCTLYSNKSALAFLFLERIQRYFTKRLFVYKRLFPAAKV